jgi:hypothetical protein
MERERASPAVCPPRLWLDFRPMRRAFRTASERHPMGLEEELRRFEVELSARRLVFYWKLCDLIGMPADTL